MRIALVSFGGVGDCISSFVAADSIRKFSQDVTVFCAVRNEVWEVIDHLFKSYNPIKLPAHIGENEIAFKYLKYGGEPEIDRIKQLYDKVYVVYNDEFFSSEFTFPYKEYGHTIESFRQTKLLNCTSDKTIIYLNLNSSTPPYQVKDPVSIIKKVAELRPNETIYVPLLEKWAGYKLDYLQEAFSAKYPGNVWIDKNPKFLDALVVLKNSCYTITIDSGIYHIAYHMNKTLLLLDNRLGINDLPWSRWRYNYHNSIPQDTPPELIAAVARENLNCEQSQLLPRELVLQLLNYTNGQPIDWKRLLFLKDF